MKNEFYIGSSVDMLKRKNQHLRELRSNKHHSYHLQNAFKECGETNFKFYALTLFVNSFTFQLY